MSGLRLPSFSGFWGWLLGEPPPPRLTFEEVQKRVKEHIQEHIEAPPREDNHAAHIQAHLDALSDTCGGTSFVTDKRWDTALKYRRPRKKPPDHIIVHWNGGGGPVDATVRFVNKSNFGYHFFVENDGTVFILAYPEDEVVQHAGKWNDRSIGVCFRAKHPFDYTPKQVEAGRVLLRRLMADFSIDSDRVLGHYQVSDHKSDPGPWLIPELLK